MDIRRLIEYRESLINKPDKTFIDYRKITQIDISIGALSSNMNNCTNFIVDMMQLKEAVSRSTNSNDLPLSFGNLQVTGYGALVNSFNKKTVYDIQRYVDDIRKIDDSNRKFVNLLRTGLMTYYEQIDRILEEQHDCEPRELFYVDLENKTSLVKEDRQVILSELFNHQGQFTFGSLTDDQRESLYSTKNDAIIHSSSEMVAKYSTLSELENKEYQKVLSRFKIK